MSSIKSRYIWILIVLVTAIISPVQGQTSVGSNIVSRTLLSSDGTSKINQRVYDNGLGDIVQEIQSYTGSTLPNLVVHHEYDEYRRRTKSWLPVMSADSLFVNVNTVASQAQSQYSDTAPFSRTVYDGFLPSQPSKQYKAGAQWQNNEKKVSVSYSEYVGVGMYSPESGFFFTFPDLKYLCTTTYDEDSCLHVEYTDMNGRLMVSETSQGKTYYLYNAKGDITYVIPPILSAYVASEYGDESEDILDTDDMMQKYAYIYRYDNQRHCIFKKLPGCDSVCYVYDKAGNCILMQDGNLRQSGKWAYSIPDKFGRPCITGICQYSGSYAAEPLHSVHVYANYDGSSATTGGYTVYGLTLNQQTLYSATYYDNYSFIGQHGVPSSLTASTVSGFSVDASLGHGLQTGSATAILSGGGVTGYTYSALYYDSRYNVSQVKATNHFGGTETTCTTYTYTGKPENVRIQHTANGLGTLVETYTYSYDGADRVSSRTLSIANGVPALSSTMTYEYDNLGRLSKVTRPFAQGTNPDVTYGYDLHGWMKTITTNRFEEELSYADGPGTPCWNGNISTIRWKDGALNPKRGYKFVYDHANRLTQATYGQGEDLTSNVNRYSEGVQYDAADGNIRKIARYGKISSSSYGLMDSLTLSYDGYRLTGVTEAVADYNATGTFEYKRANGSQYIYNSNGSLVADRSRGIAYITYDANNNPQNIYFTNGNETRYTYNAAGQKLRVVHNTAKPNITNAFGVEPAGLTSTQILSFDVTDYLLGGSLVVQNNMTKMLLFDGGYAKAERINPTAYGYTLFYYNQDHLGNIREVMNASGYLQQKTNYYPFGGIIADICSDQDIQPYKYNGKELDLMHGLNTYDYGARQYDPILARWDRVDPLAEKYYNVTPYAYCGNDPINCIDKEGKEKQQYLNREELKKSDYFQYPYNTPGILNIWAHGVYDAHYDEFASGIEVGKVGKVDDAQGFHDAILKYSSEWKKNGGENMIIVLHSCGTSDFAKKLSEDDMFKGKNITFVAPNARLKVSPKGSKINGKIFFQANTNWQKRIKTEDGRWMSYKDGELVGTESATAQPGKDNKELQKPPYNEKREE